MITIDYMWTNDERSERQDGKNPVLVAYDRNAKMILARVVPQTGVHPYPKKVYQDGFGDRDTPKRCWDQTANRPYYQ